MRNSCHVFFKIIILCFGTNASTQTLAITMLHGEETSNTGLLQELVDNFNKKENANIETEHLTTDELKPGLIKLSFERKSPE